MRRWHDESQQDATPAPSRRELLAMLAAAPLAAGAWPMHAATPAPLLARRIPSTGEELPALGLGTWRAFDVGASAAEREPLAEVLRELVDAGARLIDSSPMYGNAESVVGDLARALAVRDRLFLATKVWTRGRAEGIEQMETSMRRLGAERLDLMQVHNLVDADTHLQTLAGWKREGRVRYVGVTHYVASAHADLAAAIHRGGLDFVQVNYSIVEREAEERLLPLAREAGVAVIANRPFAGGDAFARLAGRALPDWLGERGVASWAQAMLKFTISHPAVICAIPATSKVRHLRDNLGAARGWLPDADERARLAADLERALGA